MSDRETLTRTLLQRLHANDPEALPQLLERDLEWITTQVQKRVGAQLRQNAETMDFVQDAVIDALHHGPRFVVSDKDQFRRLMARIVENAVRKRHRFLHAERRDVARAQPLPSESICDLDASKDNPARAAERSEHRAWVQLAIEMLGEADRDLVRLRQWEGMSFAEVGKVLGIEEDAARMRFKRALAKLARMVKEIRAGGLDAMLADAQ